VEREALERFSCDESCLVAEAAWGVSLPEKGDWGIFGSVRRWRNIGM
jgi:hypothetical protein